MYPSSSRFELRPTARPVDNPFCPAAQSAVGGAPKIDLGEQLFDTLSHPLRLPWVPRHLRTCVGGSIIAIRRIGHTQLDWWVECDVDYGVSSTERAVRLHPVQIVSEPNNPGAVTELTLLQEAITTYLLARGRWIEQRWQPHDRARPSRSARRLAKRRQHFKHQPGSHSWNR